tara:strand:- start:89 stop:397 length:309 start_codon:yes stop_codon:yes gene_type:complete
MKYKILSILIITILLSGCENIQRQLSMEKKENVDEFLIQKKNPLVLPPEFSKLPKPTDEINRVKDEEEEIDLSKVLKKSDETKISNQSTDLEKSISNIINKK